MNYNDSLNIRRPKLLVRAALYACKLYNPERDLQWLISKPGPSGENETVAELRHKEAQLEAARKKGDANYDLHRHISILSALMAEISRRVSQEPSPHML